MQLGLLKKILKQKRRLLRRNGVSTPSSKLPGVLPVVLFAKGLLLKLRLVRFAIVALIYKLIIMIIANLHLFGGFVLLVMVRSIGFSEGLYVLSIN